MAHRQSIPIVRPISYNLHTCSCDLELWNFHRAFTPFAFCFHYIMPPKIIFGHDLAVLADLILVILRYLFLTTLQIVCFRLHKINHLHQINLVTKILMVIILIIFFETNVVSCL